MTRPFRWRTGAVFAATGDSLMLGGRGHEPELDVPACTFEGTSRLDCMDLPPVLLQIKLRI